MKLHELAVKHGTDKAQHGYTHIYDLLFRDKRFNVSSLLEIGVQQGKSIRMWREYFPNATISGIDTKPTEEYRADQGKADELLKVMEKAREQDIIIDDGSHKISDQIVSLKTLFPFLRTDGLYIIEDVEDIEALKPHLLGYDYWFALATDTWPPEKKGGSVLAVIRKSHEVL